MVSQDLSKQELEDKLESHLKGCADKIRNAVDKTDYKDVIIPIIFYKAVSDTYKDEYEEAKEEYGEEVAGDEQFHQFQIPEEYLWEEALKRNKNIGEFLNEVFEELERANPDKLQGAFRVDYAGETGLDDSRLRRLLQHVDKENLSAERLPPDVLGKAYMHLVRHFAEEEGRDGGEFFTPPNIVKLMVNLLAPFEKGDSFHDPTAGSGGMLIEAARYFKEEQGGDPNKLRLTGQEVNPDITAIGKINLFLHNYNGEIKRGDSLSNPQFLTEDGELEKYDYVLANFPFSADWDKNELQDDKFSRFNWADKLPRADRGDYAFLEHMVSQLNERGRLAVVIPHGVLYRKYEKKYREYMLERDLIEAVISLPDNLFQNTDKPSGILILNKDKKEERENEILFINADRQEYFEELSNRNKLTPEGIKKISKSFEDWKNELKVSRVVSVEDIREKKNSNLNLGEYVDTTPESEELDVEEEIDRLRKLEQERKDLEQKVEDYIKSTEEMNGNGNKKRLPDFVGTQEEISQDNVEKEVFGNLSEEWELKPLEPSLNYLESGTDKSQNKEQKGVPVTRIETISEGKIDYEQVGYVNTDGDLESYRLNSGDILLSNINSQKELGKVAIYSGNRELYHGMNLLRVGFDKEKVNPWFGYYLLDSPQTQDVFYRKSKAAVGQASVSQGQIKKMSLPQPRKETQLKIASIFYNIDRMIEKTEEILRQERRVKEAMSEEIFGGKLAIENGNVEIEEEVKYD